MSPTQRPALPLQSRPPHAGRLTAVGAFGWRTLLKIKHVPEQLTEAVAIPLTFTVMFTYLFGGALDRSTGDYLEFILPGTLAMAVLLITMYVGVGLNVDLSKGVHDRFRTLPIWHPSPIVGTLLGEVARYLLAAGIVVALGLVLGYRPGGGAAGVAAAVGLVVLFALSLSWFWIVLGLVLRAPNAIMGVGTMVLFPLTLASNVFVDPDTMPGWLQAVVDVNPVTHLVTALRGLMDGTDAAGDVVSVLVVAAALNLALAPLALRLYRGHR